MQVPSISLRVIRLRGVANSIHFLAAMAPFMGCDKQPEMSLWKDQPPLFLGWSQEPMKLYKFPSLALLCSLLCCPVTAYAQHDIDDDLPIGVPDLLLFEEGQAVPHDEIDSITARRLVEYRALQS